MTDATTDTLCHVTTPDALAASGPAVTADPFLHCCTEAQLPFVLARHFPGRTGLIVVRFGPGAVDGRIEWVRSEPDQDPFPHLYGHLVLAGTVVTPV